MRSFALICVILPCVGQESACRSEEEITSWTIAQQYQSSVFTYQIDRGVDDEGKPITSQGSAFLICHNPVLLVTVAHTVHAENPSKITVRDNITGTVRVVKTIHVHPAYDPDDDDKGAWPEDVAILEMSEPVPKEFIRLKVSSNADTSQLQGREVVSFGFPKYVVLQERDGGSAEAVLRQGIIQATLDYNIISTNDPKESRPMLHTSLPCIDGESGCPVILLSTGEVIGVQVGNRNWKYSGTNIPGIIIPLAIHANSINELLEHMDVVVE